MANKKNVANVDSFEFTLELAKELVQPHLLRRKLVGLHQKMAGVSTDQQVELSAEGYQSSGKLWN